jgi:phosphoribosyl-AMP cyclohydrolase
MSAVMERTKAQRTWDSLRKAADGLVPAVAVDGADGPVLMVAYQDREAFLATMETGWMHYHSRSRGTLWKKGETSGHLQRVLRVLVDCDADTLLFEIEQAGAACHTGARTCFHRELDQLVEESGGNEHEPDR